MCDCYIYWFIYLSFLHFVKFPSVLENIFYSLSLNYNITYDIKSNIVTRGGRCLKDFFNIAESDFSHRKSFACKNKYDKEYVPLIISHRLNILCISKFWSMLHHGPLWRVQGKECYFMFKFTFLWLFCCFSSKNLCFYHFRFFFWWSIKFSQQNINQSETGIDDKKL